MQGAQTATRSFSHTGFHRHKAYSGKHARTNHAGTSIPGANAGAGAAIAPQGCSPKRPSRSTKATYALSTIVGIALIIACTPLLAVNITLLAKGAISDGVPTFASFVPLIVVSDSMSPTIEGGDLIVCNTCDGESVSEGNIICFLDPRSDSDTLVVHRAIEKTTKNDSLAWRTQGDANNAADSAVVPADKVIGIYEGMRIPGLGNVIMAMQTPTGVLVCVGIPLACIALWEAIRSRRLTRAAQTACEQPANEQPKCKQVAASEQTAREQSTRTKSTILQSAGMQAACTQSASLPH